MEQGKKPGAAARDEPASAPSVVADDSAFTAFYRTFVPTLVAFLRWQGVPLRDAADIAQETMIEAYRRWQTIEHPPAWTRRVASRMWARRVAQVVDGSAAESVADPPTAAAEEAELARPATGLLAITDVTAWEERHDVLLALETLPPRQRQVLAWTLADYTPTEIADELKMSPEAVRASLLKARRALAAHPRLWQDRP
jgi:RNA polymerase sigma-70 factor (ECF subfamily)